MAQRDTPFDDPTARFEAGRFGMWIFLAALGVVFASTIVGYLAVRIDNGADFVPIDAPRPPAILLASTVLLLISSVTMQRALRFGRSGDPRQGGMMLATTALAVAFLVIQLVAWRQLLSENLGPTDNLYGWTFYVLTALHAAHVVGGLPPLVITTWRASKGLYGPMDHRGITYTAMYWHFLDAVWLVLYATLWLGSMR
ncbi:MAG: cytochrome c oxidase subunit 3 [Limnohabitans sp.]|nr:cytochrome c oxidase subunit 3 [Limnohabitans sp.]